MPNKTSLSATPTITSPDYVGLVKFLLEPFLENPESLEIDCEVLTESKKIWLRVSFDNSEKGRIFGRGGRNIQAIREVLNTAATIAGQSIYLDIYNADEDKPDSSSGDRVQRDSGRSRKVGKSRPRPSKKD